MDRDLKDRLRFYYGRQYVFPFHHKFCNKRGNISLIAYIESYHQVMSELPIIHDNSVNISAETVNEILPRVGKSHYL